MLQYTHVLSSFCCCYNSVLKGTNKLPGGRGFVLQQQKQSLNANRGFFVDSQI